jgi:hypothetical protein
MSGKALKQKREVQHAVHDTAMTTTFSAVFANPFFESAAVGQATVIPQGVGRHTVSAGQQASITGISDMAQSLHYSFFMQTG